MSNTAPDVREESLPQDDGPADHNVNFSSMNSDISTMTSERDSPASPRRETATGPGHRASTVFTAAALPEFIGSRSISPAQRDASTSSNRVDFHSSSPQEGNSSLGLGHSSSGLFTRTV